MFLSLGGCPEQVSQPSRGLIMWPTEFRNSDKPLLGISLNPNPETVKRAQDSLETVPFVDFTAASRAH